MTDLHPQAPTGSQLAINARFARNHFVPGGALIYARRAKSASGFLTKRPRVRNENQDPSRQTIGGVNVEASLENMKFDLMPDVDSIAPFRAHHNGFFYIGSQLGATAGTGTITTDGDATIVGVGTAFTTQLSVGDWLSITGETLPKRVIAIADNTHLTLATGANTSASGLAFVFASIPVFPWSYHPRTPAELDPAEYIDSVDFEITDGSKPVMDYECAQADLEIKITDGKIQELSESWFGTIDTFASEATLINVVGDFADNATPSLFGHFSTANEARLPIHVRVTDAAGSGYDGKFKAGWQRTLTGTLETDNTDTVEGTGTAFVAELAVGDLVYIEGEPAPLVVESITDNDTVVFTTGATTTDTGLTATAVTFSGTAISFIFDIPSEVKVAGARIGISAFDRVWVVFPSGNDDVGVGDEWSFTEPRTIATPKFSSRDVLHAAGVQVTIDGVPYGGVPGYPGFHNITIKLSQPKKANKTTGSKYSQGTQINGRTMATISFDRDRTDTVFLDHLNQAENVSIVVQMYGNPFGDTGFDELWQLTFRNCEVADVQRDVATENTLPEKIDVNAVRGLTRELTGTITTNGTTSIVGVGTAFTTELFEGDEIYIAGETVRTVASITDATHLKLTAAASTSGSGNAANAITPIWTEYILTTRPALTAEMA